MLRNLPSTSPRIRRQVLKECADRTKDELANSSMFWSGHEGWPLSRGVLRTKPEKARAWLLKRMLECSFQENTLYIDDLRIDDQSSMLASSFLSKSTIEIDDPTVSRPDFWQFTKCLLLLSMPSKKCPLNLCFADVFFKSSKYQGNPYSYRDDNGVFRK